MTTQKSQWQTKELAASFLEGVRGAMPCADLQLEVIGKIARFWCKTPKNILDLGCGNGILGRYLLRLFPNITGVFADFSDPMLDAARKNLGNVLQTNVIKVDFSNPGWVDAVAPFLPFDIVVSGFAIHHQPDEQKKALYSEIYHVLSPGGVFLNLEHVSSRTPEVERIFDDYFIDHLFDYHSKLDKNKSREDIGHDYYRRPDKKENKLAPVDDQCRWLREIGFKDVDCFFKIFELSLFGGRKVDLNDNENKSNEDLIVIDANIEDARQILSLQKRAYIQEVEKAGDDYGISPMRQTLSEMEDDFKHYVILKAMKQSLIVGSVRARMNDEICYIGRLIVEPIFQQQGYGALLLKSIEARFPQASEFELFTGENSSENIRFYSKRGYALVENFTGPNGLKLVKMRKKGRNFSEGWLQPYKGDSVMKLSKLQKFGGMSLILGSVFLTAYSVFFFTVLPIGAGILLLLSEAKGF